MTVVGGATWDTAPEMRYGTRSLPTSNIALGDMPSYVPVSIERVAWWKVMVPLDFPSDTTIRVDTMETELTDPNDPFSSDTVVLVFDADTFNPAAPFDSIVNYGDDLYLGGTYIDGRTDLDVYGSWATTPGRMLLVAVGRAAYLTSPPVVDYVLRVGTLTEVDTTTYSAPFAPPPIDVHIGEWVYDDFLQHGVWHPRAVIWNETLFTSTDPFDEGVEPTGNGQRADQYTVLLSGQNSGLGEGYWSPRTYWDYIVYQYMEGGDERDWKLPDAHLHEAFAYLFTGDGADNPLDVNHATDALGGLTPPLVVTHYPQGKWVYDYNPGGVVPKHTFERKDLAKHDGLFADRVLVDTSSCVVGMNSYNIGAPWSTDDKTLLNYVGDDPHGWESTWSPGRSGLAQPAGASGYEIVDVSGATRYNPQIVCASRASGTYLKGTDQADAVPYAADAAQLIGVSKTYATTDDSVLKVRLHLTTMIAQIVDPTNGNLTFVTSSAVPEDMVFDELTLWCAPSPALTGDGRVMPPATVGFNPTELGKAQVTGGTWSDRFLKIGQVDSTGAATTLAPEPKTWSIVSDTRLGWQYKYQPPIIRWRFQQVTRTTEEIPTVLLVPNLAAGMGDTDRRFAGD